MLLEVAWASYIVGISEETNASNHACSDVVPAERSLVNLSESKTPSLIWVLDVGEVIVEVVEGVVAARSGVSCHRIGYVM